MARALVAVAPLAFFTGNVLPAYAASLNQDLNAPPIVAPVDLTPPAKPQPVVGGKARPVPQKALSDAAQPSAEATAAVVNKLLAPREGDAGVPLSQENLAQAPVSTTSYDGPRIYGRGEPGGGVLGFKFAIPVSRGTSDSHTTYSGVAAGTGTVPEGQKN